jgi:hypothetical protein
MDLKNIRLRLSSTGYLMNGKNNYFHRIIWENERGEIPEGFDVHHKDGNKLNNAIENLECISHSEHLSKHMKGKKIPNSWYKTPAGKKYRSEKSIETWKNREVHTLKCLQCGKDFQAIQIDRAKYCDNKCEQRARRSRGDDNVERTCAICSKTFSINRYQKTLTCGSTCGSKYRTRFAIGKRHGT